MTNTKLMDNLREKEVAKLLEILKAHDYDMVGQCHSNKICFPTLDEEGNERDVVITVTIPKKDFDSLQAQEDYKFDLATKAKEKTKKEEG